MLKSLLELDPNFHKNYSNEIRHVNRSIALEEAQIHWRKKENKLARELINPFVNDSIKYRLFFLLMFFPYSFYNYILKLGGSIRPNY